MAERGLPVAKSLSNPRRSFCRPRIKGRFSRGPVVRVFEDPGRPNDACSRTSRGRAIEWVYMYKLLFLMRVCKVELGEVEASYRQRKNVVTKSRRTTTNRESETDGEGGTYQR